MFHHETDASKIAIVTLMKLLHHHGISWLDTQMVTSVIGDLGGIEVCLLYTSDAADDSLRVDLGGRRIIKKNTP